MITFYAWLNKLNEERASAVAPEILQGYDLEFRRRLEQMATDISDSRSCVDSSNDSSTAPSLTPEETAATSPTMFWVPCCETASTLATTLSNRCNTFLRRC